MTKREPLAESKSLYFIERNKDDMEFIGSGSTLLDLVLGGGYPLRRIVNVVGDKSTGKTLLAIEACSKFAETYDGPIWYTEAEAAFDPRYAEALGMPLDRVSISNDCFTVEDLYEDLEDKIKKMDKGSRGLYILDSLDALSDRAEQDRDIGDGTYGANKAKQMSALFRKLNQKLSKSNICFIIISQVRDNIGVTFGKKYSRSGGRGLDFYASQVIYLAQMSKKKRTVNKVERTTGIVVRARCEKNKVAMPFRDCEIDITFGYGIDDIKSNVSFLKKIDKLEEITSEKPDKYLKGLDQLNDEDFEKENNRIAELVVEHWFDIEKSFLPTRSKYKK
jgi:recombination protein RecA